MDEDGDCGMRWDTNIRHYTDVSYDSSHQFLPIYYNSSFVFSNLSVRTVQTNDLIDTQSV